MTLDAYIGNINTVVKVFNFILDALSEFEGKYNKKFNFTKLAKYLKIPKTEIDKIVSLIFNFQEKFETVFKDYRLKEKLINNQIYIISEKKGSSPESTEVKNAIPEEISLQKSEAKLLSDVVYLFKFVKRGKGFDLSTNGTDLLTNIKNLKTTHPYLFNVRDNLIYPSETGLELGNVILSHNKSNKKIKNIEINNCKFRIE